MFKFPSWRQPSRKPSWLSRTRLVLEALEDRTLFSINPIVAENQLSGTPQSVWDVPTGDAGDPTIQGFATAISVNHGQTISFKINDTKKAAYHLDIYRMGYYQGNGARKVATISSTQTQDFVQPSPLTTSATGLIECGNWSVTASWAVPSSAVSGIYFADVIRNDTGGMSQIFFVVRDDNDSNPSDVLLKTSDSTWEAYNDYGGNSLYSGSPRNYGPYSGAYQVSYNRPFNNRSDNQQSYVYNAEYPMVRWLEANGYNVSYTTDVDSAESDTQILQHKIFMSVGHDEYWSAPERNNITAARAAGINLAFFSGNEGFWETRWLPSTDNSATPYRTMVCYKETFNPGIDPQDPPQWTGTWRDPRQPAGAQPENALTGTLFMVNGSRDDAMTLSSNFAKLRFWRNTAVASLGAGQSYTTSTGVLGYEWDVKPDNGVEPAGSFALSTTTLDVSPVYLLDYGGTFGAGTATQSQVMYRDPTSHALVFGAGTVQWAWALDINHDRGSANDTTNVNVQQATVNLLADMGVQPGSLASGLVAATASTDTTPPISTITSPTGGTVFTAGSPVTITGTATDSGGGVVAGVEVSVDGGSTWHPATMSAADTTVSWSFTWTPASAGSLSIKSRAVDDSGNLETPSAGQTVTVILQGDTLLSPSAKPASLPSQPDPRSVELGMKFTSDAAGYVAGVRFYKGPLNTGTHVGQLWTVSGQLLASVSFTAETIAGWQQANFSSPVAINANSTYVISYFAPRGGYAEDDGYFNGGVDNPPLHAPSDAASGGNGVYAYSSTSTFPNQTYSAANYWVDVVFTEPNTVNPIIYSVSPAPNTGRVSTSPQVTVTFNKAMDPTTINTGTILLKDPSGNPVAATVSYNASFQTAFLRPSWPLSPATLYTVTVLGGSTGPAVKDSSSHPLASTYTSSFLTNGPAPTISSTAPASGATGVATTANVMVTFSHAMDPTSLTAADLYLKDSAGKVVPAAVSYNATTDTATLTPFGFLATSASYTAIVVGGSGGVLDLNGQGLAAGFSWSFTTAAQAAFYPSLWKPVNLPQNPSSGDNSSVEVGVLFYSTVAGYVTGVRFYKGTANTGTHIGNLWDANGNQLATGTFTNETASGWQQVNFASPVLINANTTYVASYFAPNGNYAADQSYFSSGVDASPLHAPSDAAAGGNGVYAYSSTSSFPNQTYSATNYWVDVVFKVVPTVTATSPPANAGRVSTTAPITATFSEALDPTTVTTSSVFLKDPSGNVIPASVSYSGSNNAVTLTPRAALSTVTYYTAYLLGGSSGVKDPAGNAMPSTYSWSFLTDGPTPTISSIAPASGATGVASTASVMVTFSQAMDPTTLTAANLYLKDSAGNLVPAAISYNSSTYTATVTPYGFLSTSATYTATVAGGSSGVLDLNGRGLAAGSSQSFTTGSQASFYPSLWKPINTPQNPSSGDSSSIEVGVMCYSTVAGYITGVRFYKGAGNSGTHIGNLWDANGKLLATATFTNESASGWQQVNFGNSVAIQANADYVASYFAPNGNYAEDDGYFNSGLDAFPLHAPSDSTAGGNGLYAYSSTSTFPNQGLNASNFWVDVVFSTTPAVVAVTPLAGATGVSRSAPITITFDRDMDPTSLNGSTVFLKDSAGNLVAATVSYNASTDTATITPAAPLNAGAVYKIWILGGTTGPRVKDQYGNYLTVDYTWSFTTGQV